MLLLKILEDKAPIAEACKYTYWRRFPTGRGLLLLPTKLDPPNPHCYICAEGSINVWVDPETMQFEAFLSKVLKGKLGFNQPTVSF